MSLRKITPGEVAENAVSSLSTRPSAPSLYEGRSLSAKELKAAFDRLPRLAIDRFNALIDTLGLYGTEGEKSTFADYIATGLAENHSLSDLFRDIASGALAGRLSVGGGNVLSEWLTAYAAKTAALETLLAKVATIAVIEDPENGKRYHYGLALQCGKPGILLTEID